MKEEEKSMCKRASARGTANKRNILQLERHAAFGERTMSFKYFGLCRYSWENFIRVRIFCVIHLYTDTAHRVDDGDDADDLKKIRNHFFYII